MKFGVSRKWFENTLSRFRLFPFCLNIACRHCPFYKKDGLCLKDRFNDVLHELIEKYPKETCPTYGKEIENGKERV